MVDDNTNKVNQGHVGDINNQVKATLGGEPFTSQLQQRQDGTSNENMEIPAQLEEYMRHNNEQLSDFMAAHNRLREKLSSKRSDIISLRGQMMDCQSDFNSTLDYLRNQVAPLLPSSSLTVRSPTVPPSTPAE